MKKNELMGICSGGGLVIGSLLGILLTVLSDMGSLSLGLIYGAGIGLIVGSLIGLHLYNKK